MRSLRKFMSILLSLSIAFSVFTVAPLTAEAASTGVSTWQELLSEINGTTNGTITLANDITAGSSDAGVTIDGGKNITLDLNGHTLSRGLYQNKQDGSVITVKKQGSLTIKDSGGKDEGTIAGGHSKDGGGIFNEGTLRLESGQIEGNAAAERGGGIYNKGTLTVVGGFVDENVSKDGGGIYNDIAGTVTLKGEAGITLNKSSENEGGGIANYGTLSVSENAFIKYNYAYTSGGGIFNNGKTAIDGGEITGNNATNAGSGIFNGGDMTLQGKSIVKDNFGDDVFVLEGKTISVTGALQSGTKVGVTSVGEKAVLTTGYGLHNSADPSQFFFENGDNCKAVVKKGNEVGLNTDGIPYIERGLKDDDKTTVTKTIKHLTSYTTVTGSLTELTGGNWYVVKDTVTIAPRVNNNGKANLLLCDKAKIEFSEGIRSEAAMSSELNIYGQQEGDGTLVAANSNRDSAIGANQNNKNGTVNTYGGTIELLKNKGYYCFGAASRSAGGVYRFYGCDVSCGDIGCGDRSATDTTAYIGIFNSKISSRLHNGAGVLDIYNSWINGRGAIYAPAAIGGYADCTQMGDINIYNSYVKGHTEGDGAVIGSNRNCDGGNIRIVNSTVDARCHQDSVYGKGNGASIGSGKGGMGGNILIDHSCVVATAYVGAGIGAGKGRSGGTITINDSVVMASSEQGGAGIGGGDDGHGGTISINNSYVHAKTESKEDIGAYSGKSMEKALYSICFEMMRKSMKIGETGSGSQVAFYHAGYLAGFFLTLIIAPKHGGAAIGGGDKGDSGTINIEGSDIIAEGGKYAAGIGGGDKGGFNNITIKGSAVSATGGKCAAGIGSGDGGKKTETITISDGSDVTASGGKDAAGIGGGQKSNGGTIEITASTVTATGNNCGPGIGSGESGDSATININYGSTVEAFSGGKGAAAAIGQGDYYFKGAKITSYLAPELLVKAGKNSSSAKQYTGQSRYNAVWSNKYAKVYPCDHKDAKWSYATEALHKKVCNVCGKATGDFEAHHFNDQDTCTVCGGSATKVDLTLIEKDSTGQEVATTVKVPKFTEYTLPECKNTPSNMEFVCWRWKDADENVCVDPGTVVTAIGGTLEAVYLPLVETEYIDAHGNRNKVMARRLNADVTYLSSGWYVADSSFDYTDNGSTLTTRGVVHLILADGVAVDLNRYSNNTHPPLETLDIDNTYSEFNLYGQEAQSGKLRFDTERYGSMTFARLAMYGGNLQTNRRVIVHHGTEIWRGKLDADTFNESQQFDFCGGNVTVNTFPTRIENIIGWTEWTDSIKLNAISAYDTGIITIEEGQAFTDGTNVYTGTLTADQMNAIQGKTLTPYELHHYGTPEWLWSDNYDDAIAIFTCTDENCGNQEAYDAEITVEETSDDTVYTATVTFEGTDYQDVQTVSKHIHSLEYHEPIIATENDTDENGEIRNGSMEYWRCEECGKYFADEDCDQEITLSAAVVPYLVYKADGDDAAVTKYNGGDIAVTVPDTVPMNYPDASLRGKKVTAIDACAFENSDICYVTMGDNIQMIGWRAFNSCKELREVFVGSGLDYMCSEAFNDCPKLGDFTSTTRQTFESGKYYNPFTGGTRFVAVYGYHDTSLQQKVGVNYPFIGLDRHTDPTWNWAADHSSATAWFDCTGCTYNTYLTDNNVTVNDYVDRTVYTAEVYVTGQVYTDTQTVYKDVPESRLYGYTLSLDGDIGINFFVELGEDLAKSETAFMRFEIPKNGDPDIRTVKVKDARKVTVGSKTYHVFKCQVAAKEMTSTVKARIIDGDRLGTEYTYSVKEYADYLLAHTGENTEYAKAETLVKAMLNYGAYAQINFDKNPTNLANADLPDDEKDLGDVTINVADPVIGEFPEGTTYVGSTLSLKSETTLSHYLKSNETLTFKCDKYQVETVKSGDYQVARIRGIKARNIGDTITLRVNNIDVRYSPLNYCKKVLEDPAEDVKLKNAVKALYLYYQAADSYFPKETID